MSCQLLLHYHIRKERESISMCYVNGCRHFSWTAAWNLFPRCFFLFHPFALLSLSLSLRSLVAFFNVGMLDHRRPKWWIGAGIAKEWMEGKRDDDKKRKRERERETDVQTAARRKHRIVLAEKARKLLTWFRHRVGCFIRNSARWIMSVSRTRGTIVVGNYWRIDLAGAASV